MRKYFVGVIFLFFALSIFSRDAFAKIGVGVGTGKIKVEEQLKPGIIYKLPLITVINTGDTPSDYAVSVAYQTGQAELSPKADWFIFSPQKFHLDPGKGQAVDIKLNLPLSVQPGKYFAYLEAQPFLKAQKGQTSIGIAAASRLYFTVVPANIFMAIYYKINSFWNVYAPWPQRFLILIVLILAGVFFKRFFNIQIGLKKFENVNSRSSDQSSSHRLSRRERILQKQNKLADKQDKNE